MMPRAGVLLDSTTAVQLDGVTLAVAADLTATDVSFNFFPQ